MRNVYQGIGKVIAFNFKKASEINAKSDCLNVVVAVPVGDRIKNKQQGEYDPSQTFQVAVWGQRADYLQNRISVGARVFFEGTLGIPSVYKKKDGTRGISQQISQLKEFNLLDYSTNTESVPDKAGSSKSATPYDDDEDLLF